ncbi:T9SS type A sorting domain-containing protein [Hymenobacter saemangeumensis]
MVVLPASLSRAATTAELVDALGRVVLAQQLGASAAAQPLSLQGVAAGVYALRLATAQGTISKKLVVE